jgi:hypothetical protein
MEKTKSSNLQYTHRVNERDIELLLFVFCTFFSYIARSYTVYTNSLQKNGMLQEVVFCVRKSRSEIG